MIEIVTRIHQDRDGIGRLRLDIETPPVMGTKLELAVRDHMVAKIRAALTDLMRDMVTAGVGTDVRSAEGEEAKALSREMFRVAGVPESPTEGGQN